MMLVPAAAPLVAGLMPSIQGMPSLHGSCSSACSVVPARLVQMAATSSGAIGPEPRTVELCQVNDEGQISECEVHEYDALVEKLGASGPEALDELLFEVPSSIDERRRLTLADWQKLCAWQKTVQTLCGDDWHRLCEADECELLPEVTEDVLQKALGPEHNALAKTRLHLHFGAGRLGLGLVVPAVSASGVPFAAVQRPKARWQQLFRHGGSKPDQLRMSVNSKVVVQNVEVVAASEGVPEAMPPQSLVFGSSLDELGELLSRATSFSCSLGGAMEGVLLPLLSSLPECDDQAEPPLLFACENDHAAVESLQRKLAGRVDVVSCMVDRVCTGCEVSGEGVDVVAEPWRGSIVVLEPKLHGDHNRVRLPFCPSVVTVPGCEREAEYLCERKLSLVNGMHTVLAFMTLDALFSEADAQVNLPLTLSLSLTLTLSPHPNPNPNPDPNPNPNPTLHQAEGKEHVLLKYSDMGRDAQRTCEAWRAARVARLLDDFGTDNIMRWHGLSSREEAWELLLAHADHVLEERFSQVDDLVSRVLGGGVRERWGGRLEPVQSWVSERESSAELGAFLAFCLRRDRQRAIDRGCSVEELEAPEAGCEVEAGGAQRYGVAAEHTAATAFVSARLGSLADEARRFFPHERAITHKEPKTKGVVAPVPKGARSAPKPKGVVAPVPKGEPTVAVRSLTESARSGASVKTVELGRLFDI